MYAEDLNSISIFQTKQNGNNQTGFFLEEKPITNENWKFFVFLIVLSTMFLLFSVIIYILLRDKQNIHGWTQFSYLLSFLLFNLVFIPALCPGLVQGSEVTWECFILAVANQYFFICSKTWLLVIAFDILWNLWRFELSMDGNGRHLKRLGWYSLIGCGFPAIFVTFGISLNLMNQPVLKSTPYDRSLWVSVPDYGHLHCRIPNWNVWEVFVFSNCLSHIVMFGLIIFFILRHRYNARDVIQSSSRQNSQSIVMFIKLFFVVGLSWSYIALQDLLQAGNINTRQGWGWHVFRIVYFLQGVFISLIYICNEKTLRSLQEKYPGFKNLTNALNKRTQCQACSWAKLRRESLSTLSTLSSLHISRTKVWTVSDIATQHNNNKKNSTVIMA